MTSEKSLSRKKITQQTISISPALKNKIENYVSESNKKNPKDKRFRSVSAFHNYVMERTMEIFSKGKTLDDFDIFVDSEIQGFFDKISFKGMIPYYENAVKTNRYSNLTLDNTPQFFLALRRLYMGMMDPRDPKSIKNVFDRIGKYLLSNNLTKEYNIDIFTGKRNEDMKAVFEYVGIYKNLFNEFCKYTAAFFGLLGTKVSDFLYSEKDLYYRLDLEATELFFRDEPARKDRIKLMDYNLSYLINYMRIINDLDFYLWMRMAEDKETFISFKNKKDHEEWFALVYDDIKKFGDNEKEFLNLLKFFEKLHWIEIEDGDDLTFVFTLSKLKNSIEREFLLETLSKYCQISEDNEVFQLKELK